MKKIELVYMEMMYQCIEKKNRRLTQSGLAKALGISLSTVSHGLRPLKSMGAIEVKKRSLVIIDPKKVLYHWASQRNIEKDVLYSTRVDAPVRQIESQMPAGIVFGAYSAFRLKRKTIPADYSEVYVYGSPEEIQERFPAAAKTPNLFVLKKEKIMEHYGSVAPFGLIFVDLWNLREWYAKEFLRDLGDLNGILE